MPPELPKLRTPLRNTCRCIRLRLVNSHKLRVFTDAKRETETPPERVRLTGPSDGVIRLLFNPDGDPAYPAPVSCDDPDWINSLTGIQIARGSSARKPGNTLGSKKRKKKKKKKKR